VRKCPFELRAQKETGCALVGFAPVAALISAFAGGAQKLLTHFPHSPHRSRTPGQESVPPEVRPARVQRLDSFRLVPRSPPPPPPGTAAMWAVK